MAGINGGARIAGFERLGRRRAFFDLDQHRGEPDP
jgi:hypothetical protein